MTSERQRGRPKGTGTGPRKKRIPCGKCAHWRETPGESFGHGRCSKLETHHHKTDTITCPESSPVEGYDPDAPRTCAKCGEPLSSRAKKDATLCADCGLALTKERHHAWFKGRVAEVRAAKRDNGEKTS